MLLRRRLSGTSSRAHQFFGNLTAPIRYPDGRFRQPDGISRMVDVTVAERVLTVGVVEESARGYRCNYDPVVLELYGRRDTTGIVARLEGRVR